MKRITSLLLSAVMTIVLAFGVTGPAVFAADLDTPIEEEEISEVLYSGINYGTSWTTIAETSGSSGFNCNFQVSCLNTSFVPGTFATVSPTDIRMLGKNGNVVWEESGAVAGLGSRVFWCGSDVYKIQARCQYGSGVIYITPSN